MGKRRRGRAINGVLVLDKPQGVSSNAALQAARRAFDAAKAGHTGSLDPLATGVLPICFGEATKFSQYLLDADKAYISTYTLGQQTDTGDAAGQVIASCDASHLEKNDIEREMTAFVGDIEQVPPMYSALKHQGQPLYKLARQGIDIERKARRVHIYEYRLDAFRVGMVSEADVYIRCSKGTYVRSLVEDLGAALAVGGHVKMLRRVKAGPFIEPQAVTIEQLEMMKLEGGFAAIDQLLQPADTALLDFPEVVLDAGSEFYLLQGQSVFVSGLPSLRGEVRLKNDLGEFLGLGEIQEDGKVAPKRIIATN